LVLALAGALTGIAPAQVVEIAQAPAPAPPPPPAAPQFVWIGGPGSYLGVGVREVSADRVKELKLKEERGVEITAVDSESPASKAGLQKGDVVLSLNGTRVEGMEQFVRMVRETPAGREVRLEISRDGKTQLIGAKVGDRKDVSFRGGRPMRLEVPDIPAMPPMPRVLTYWSGGYLGIEAEGLEGGMAEFFGVKQGVLVRKVTKGSAAEKAGLQVGDVIVKVDGEAVDSPTEVTTEIRERARENKLTFPLSVVRNKAEMSLNVTVEAPRERERPMPAPAGRRVTAPRQF
jgi:S1-C subfamily serine protease